MLITMSSSCHSFANFTVTQEQFNMFHSIDRLLFTRLVHNLGREPGESMQVIGLWIWLEQSGQCRDLVDNMLTWPNRLITSLADEAVLCLNCIESDKFPFSLENNNNIDVPLTQGITKTRVSLRFFHENRLTILHGVTRIINEVCARAFGDILQHVRPESSGSLVREEMMKQLSHNYGPVISSVLPVMHQNFGVGEFEQIMVSTPQYFQGFDPNELAVQRSISSNDEIVEMLNGIQISSGDYSQEMKEVPQDERTIFLTFSRGYPISENEIKDFFTRGFGECIETIYMQEVATAEQPLYARLVLYSGSMMEVVLDGKSKAKFSINGKHVWARKFVRRNHRSPPRSSTPPQQLSGTTACDSYSN